MTLKEHLNKKFVFVNEVADVLTIGLASKKNVFLYGRGGHAKSEIIQEFLKYIDPTGEDSFVQACGEGLTTEKLFGGMDLKKFQETGEVEYLVKNSFMNKKYVVFEELLDSRMNVLLELKDILTSGKFRQGKQTFDIRTEFVVVLTNRTKQEVSEDNSIKAMLERFPLEQKVEWNDYSKSTYSHMFSKVLGNSYGVVAEICHRINEEGDFVSPRTAIHMAEVYRATDNVNDLKYFGASTDIISKMEEARKDQSDLTELNSLHKQYESLCNSKDFSTVSLCKDYILKLKAILVTIEGNTYNGDNYNIFCDLRNACIKQVERGKDELFKLIENE